MDDNDIISVIDYGKSKIRLAIFNKHFKKLYSKSNKVEKEFNLKEFVRKCEKNISTHINNLVILFDSKKLLSIDFCYKRKLNNEEFSKKNYLELKKEILQLIQINYPNYEILETLNLNVSLDHQKFKDIPQKIKVKNLIIEFKFLCMDKIEFHNLINKFKKENLNVLKIYFNSYLKSINYCKQFEKKKILFFLDIGWEKSCLNIIQNEKLLYCKNISIGSNHITKDISKIFEVDYYSAENIKKSFFKKNEEFFFDDKYINSNIENFWRINNKKISTYKLKKVIFARAQELINLSLCEVYFYDDLLKKKEIKLILTGEGSKLFNQNLFYFENKFDFKDICYYEENDDEICLNGAKHYLSFKNNIYEKSKKTGFFEKFFNLFSNN